MSHEYVTTGYVKDGKLVVRHRERFESAFKGWRDGEVIITIARAHATRSLESNSYYWAVIVEAMAEHTGYTPNECHEYLKARFLPKKLAVTGENGQLVDEMVLGGTTTTLNKIQFGEYVTQIRHWLFMDLGVDTPNPNRERLTSADAAAEAP